MWTTLTIDRYQFLFRIKRLLPDLEYLSVHSGVTIQTDDLISHYRLTYRILLLMAVFAGMFEL